MEEIKNDLGLRAGDKEGMMSRLSAQGVNASAVGGYGSAGDQSTGFGRPLLKSMSVDSVGKMLTRPQTLKNTTGILSTGKKGNEMSVKNSFEASRDESNSDEYGMILLEALREQLFSRGGKGLIGLQRQFRFMDEDGSNTLDLKEFKKAMQDSSVRMKKASDAEILFKLFGKNCVIFVP